MGWLALPAQKRAIKTQARANTYAGYQSCRKLYILFYHRAWINTAANKTEKRVHYVPLMQEV